MEKLADALTKEPKAKRIMQDFQSRRQAAFSKSSPSLVQHGQHHVFSTSSFSSPSPMHSAKRKTRHSDNDDNDADSLSHDYSMIQENKRRKADQGDPIRVFINIADTIQVPVDLMSSDNADQFRKGVLGAFKQKFGQSAPDFQILDITRTSANSSTADSHHTTASRAKNSSGKNNAREKTNTVENANTAMETADSTLSSTHSSTASSLSGSSTSTSSTSPLSTSSIEHGTGVRRSSRRAGKRGNQSLPASQSNAKNATPTEMPVHFQEQDTVQQHFKQNDTITIHAAPIKKLERDFSEELLRVRRLERSDHDQKSESVGCKPYCKPMAEFGDNTTKCHSCHLIKPYAMPQRYGIYCSPWCVHHAKLVHNDASHRKRAEARKVKKANMHFCSTCLSRYAKHEQRASNDTEAHQCRLCHRPWLQLEQDNLCTNCTNVINQRPRRQWFIAQGKVMSDVTSNATYAQRAFPSSLIALHSMHASTGTLLSSPSSLVQHADPEFKTRMRSKRRPSNVVTEEEVAKELLSLEQSRTEGLMQLETTSSSSSSSSSSSRRKIE
eukprot:TRINITY_DN4313_c1_g1_i1.p1 TRINITY_DN4313_c1_g1~~TRINITY_DN4313_c1_g1_i1.p1  ORF type:complete len:567 (-),score=125.19 TRINITY_DN4313_c1_g1_i1:658-2319(-)